MVEIAVSSDREYRISIGLDWRGECESIRSRYSKVLIIAPAELKGLLNFADETVFYVPEGESQKDIAIVSQVWDVLGRLQLGRTDAIIGIGGGATTDLAGFVAATWLRGVDWFAIPTTLAAMVDASIGGKTGINTSAGKNLVGAFYSPSHVIIDTVFLDSLSDRDYAAGLAEVIKTGLIADASILSRLEGLNTISEVREYSAELIEKSARVKADVVSKDFKEGKLREILNFGHTFGHAVEKSMNYELRHGEAVAIGLVYALELSQDLAGFDANQTSKVVALLTKFGLPITVTGLSFEELLQLMLGDKKTRGSQLRFIGLEDIGHPVWFEGVAIERAQSVYERIRS
jgi:3-dehydroquinate synthase